MAELPPPIINAAGSLTWLGGGPLHESVAEAMRQATAATWDLFELHDWASRALREDLGVPDVLVTAGASAAMTLSAAAVLACHQERRVAALPSRGEELHLAIAGSQRNRYDRAWALPGFSYEEFDLTDSISESSPRALAAVLSRSDVLGVVFVYGPGENTRALENVVREAHVHGMPVLVDAAAVLPPLDRLLGIVGAGADLVAVSGGKALGGPQNSGLLIGSREWLRAARLQMLDLDADTGGMEDWVGPRPDGIPRHGLGRGFKVSKEAIAGLVAAVRRFTAEYDAIWSCWMDRLDAVASGLADQGIASARDNEASGGPILRVKTGSGEALPVAERLRAACPRIEVGRGEVTRDILTISPVMLRDEDVPALIHAWGKTGKPEKDGDHP